MSHKILLTFFLAVFSQLVGNEPSAVYLTWTDDPTTTMTIQWHTEGKETSQSLVSFHKLGDEDWKQAEGNVITYVGTSLLVHTLKLQGLESGSDYVFHFGEGGREYRFRTMPGTHERPIRFVVGGDAYFYFYLFRDMNEEIAKVDPDFVVIGGDIAYTNNNPSLFKGNNWELRRWQTFFSEWQKTMIGKDGRMIPMLAVIGNHDIKKVKGEVPPGVTPPFYELFAMPEPMKAYRVLDFGNYLSLILLDTGHYSPICGEQTAWLESVLEKRSDCLYKMAVYHIAAYPSVYPYDSATPRRLRYQWVPLFEKYGLDTAFENHNHAYKRTYRIKAGKVDPDGVQYLGDGSWGVAPRAPKSDLWYMAKTAKINSIWIVTLEDGKCTYESRTNKGKVIESLAQEKQAVAAD